MSVISKFSLEFFFLKKMGKGNGKGGRRETYPNPNSGLLLTISKYLYPT